MVGRGEKALVCIVAYRIKSFDKSFIEKDNIELRYFCSRQYSCRSANMKMNPLYDYNRVETTQVSGGITV